MGLGEREREFEREDTQTGIFLTARHPILAFHFEFPAHSLIVYIRLSLYISTQEVWVLLATIVHPCALTQRPKSVRRRTPA